ncbi:hypothetical protein P692DRAFT_2096346 [Suillus brevipes Sb2]|nr:hypothetical protein P692DRAFT_2096346 [Suillus brevipes Sb2]
MIYEHQEKLCGHRWLKRLMPKGSLQEFRAYWNSLEKTRQESYNTEAWLPTACRLQTWRDYHTNGRACGWPIFTAILLLCDPRDALFFVDSR